MDSNPICHPSPAIKMKCLFLDYVQLLMIGWAGRWTQTPSPAKIMKCSFLDYIQLLMIGRAGRWTQTPSPAKIMKCSFLDYVQLLMISWAGRWTQTPSPAKIMKCSFLDYIQLLMISWAGQWTQTPSTTALQPKKWNACFWITFTYWWSARLVDGLQPHLPPISSQKHEMLIFGLCSTSDDQMAWLMDSKPICNPSAARKMKCSFLDYVQFLMIGQAGWWTWTPSTTPLHLKKWNAHFWIMFNFWWSAGLVDVLKSLLPPLSSQKYEMLILKLCSTSDDWPGWLMDSNSICNCSAAKKMKCSFLDFIQFLMIGQAGQWTQTPSAIPLQP